LKHSLEKKWYHEHNNEWLYYLRAQQKYQDSFHDRQLEETITATTQTRQPV